MSETQTSRDESTDPNKNTPIDTEKTPLDRLKRIGQTVITTVILALLLGTITSGTSENMHAQMLKLGAYIWDDYFVLRGERHQ